MSAPTRTRPGDQVLPTGDESIPDDQSLIIADLEERRRLGIERYGQGHRPFNGRDTLLDMYEEQLDLLVYLRSIRRSSEATREELVTVVARAIEVIPAANDVGQIAEVAVDRIMSWVAANIIKETE